ncbi:MAG: sulfotransferase [Gemmatimonadetes bacterium]|nr:sulfotransferase [Gemmatimonadota bacterium]
MLPNFIGIGAPRSGTTWLFHCLRDHRDVFVAECKETNFFVYDTIEGRLAEYEAHFQARKNEKAVGEISPRYLNSPLVAERIRSLVPDVRLFVSLRDPVEQVYSHYWHLSRQNFHQWDRTRVPQSFEDALDQYEDKLLQPALYAEQLRRWLAHFPADQLYVMVYDDLRARPESVIRDLYQHLGVDESFIPQSLNARGTSVRAGVSPRGAFLGSVHSFLHDQANRNLYQPLKNWLGVKRALRIKEGLRVRELLEAVFMRKGYPRMKDDTRLMLRERLRGEVEALSQLIGRRLDGWL